MTSCALVTEVQTCALPISLLSMTVLVASYLTVILAYPALAGTPPPASRPVRWLRDRLARLGRPPPLVLGALIVAGVALLVIGGMRLRFVDDIRALQSSPHNLLAEESTVSSEERRVGKEGVSKFRTRWSPDH